MDARTWLTSRHDLHVTAATLAALAGARGPVVVQSSACASSAKVLATAARWLEHGVVDAVICGGVDSFCAYTVLGFHGLGILSSQPTRPFSAARDGINLGEAAALLVVERAGEPRVWLRGVGETSDAWHQTQPRPDGDGLAEAMRRALAQAGMRPEEVALVNAHATGTPANDAAEAAAMRAVLPHGPWVSATKAQTGHTLGAAGGLEAVLTALSLERGFVPPLCSAAPFDEGVAGFGLPHEVVRAPLKVGMSLSAAFAGHNAAVILEAP
jgi:3-oxoacyl-[acyl-carrier-protein] synthase-1